MENTAVFCQPTSCHLRTGGLVVVLVWIGGLKAFAYEDEGIVPFVANSPLMSFFYHQPAGEYRQHMNPAGELVPANREWHERNGTYVFAYGQ
jgi:reactive chlorine resistance protein C